MPGIAEIALGAAPIAGGALLGAVAGNLKAPDVRAVIKADLDMLDRIPEDQVQRRAAMSQMIGARIDDLITADQRGRELRQAGQAIGAAGATSWCSSAQCCSPSCGGTSTIITRTGCRCSSCSS